VAGLGLVAVVVGGSVLAGRPVSYTPTTQDMGRRDIVLCLDVSGSMTQYDRQIVTTFQSMVQSFHGERIALSVFNATSRTVFPLTDDYDMVLEELDTVGKGLDVDLSSIVYVEDLEKVLSQEQLDALMDVWAGTLGVDGASLIGDGLASCALLFDPDDAQRSRSIILATDNDLAGVPIYSLDEAVDLVQNRGSSLYGLYPDDMRGTYQDHDFASAIRAGGGEVWYAEDPAAVQGIVGEVVADQARVIAADTPPQVGDHQKPWTTMTGIGLLVLLVARGWGRR
jgi:Ca-activated chloride channel homolog